MFDKKEDKSVCNFFHKSVKKVAWLPPEQVNEVRIGVFPRKK